MHKVYSSEYGWKGPLNNKHSHFFGWAGAWGGGKVRHLVALKDIWSTYFNGFSLKLPQTKENRKS